jgi:RsiW-degrading membrane proteinase PrsW (M82 family)/pSer/pThr/pTyr-binding forkhead associated (FHA) protein
MSVSQNYGVLRVVRVRPPANATTELQDKYPAGWLPEERLVHLLTRRETSIGRALNNGIILMDPTVSREHARLVLGEQGWCVYNLTVRNVVRVNGRPVPSGGCVAIRPQDFLVLGSTMLQLVAPQFEVSSILDEITTKIHKPTTLKQTLPILHIYPLEDETTSNGNGTHHPQENGTSLVSRKSASLVHQHAGQLLSGARVLPIQPEPELIAQPWDDYEENLLGAGVTMQFALPQRMGTRSRILIAGIGVAILLVSAIVTIIMNSLIGLSAFERSGPSSIVAALTIPLIPVIGIALLVNFIDRFEREPWFLRLAAFLWGAIIAIPPASFVEQNLDSLILNIPLLGNNPLIHAIFQGLGVGITEETVKGLGLLLLFLLLRDEFDNVTDGIVYGALIGAGFAMVENFIYFAFDAKEFLVFLIVGRIVLGWLCHSTFTVCFGVALGYIRHTRVRWRQICIPFIGYFIAVGLHSVFDFITYYVNSIVINSPTDPLVNTISLIAIIGDYIPPFIAQLVIVYFLIKALAHEAAVIREFLAQEVSNGIVRVDEYALLQNSFHRTREERRIFHKSGFKQWLRVKALYQTEIGLAFRKWHVSMGDKPKLGYLQPEDAYRERIKRLRKEILSADLHCKRSEVI